MLDCGIKEEIDLDSHPCFLNLPQLPIIVWLNKCSVKSKKISELVGISCSLKLGEGKGVILPIGSPTISSCNITLETRDLLELMSYLIDCREGKSWLNPVTWKRYFCKGKNCYYFAPTEITQRPSNYSPIVSKLKSIGSFFIIDEVNAIQLEDKYLINRDISLEVNYINPIKIAPSPLYFAQRELSQLEEKWLIVQIPNEAILILSKEGVKFNLNDGIIKLENAKELILKHGLRWEYLLAHVEQVEIENEPIIVDLIPTVNPISLLEVKPNCVLPIEYKFKSGIFTIKLFNASGNSLNSQLRIAGRIKKAVLRYPEGELEGSPNYDKIIIPIGSWSVVEVEMELGRIPKELLKRFYPKY